MSSSHHFIGCLLAARSLTQPYFSETRAPHVHLLQLWPADQSPITPCPGASVPGCAALLRGPREANVLDPKIGPCPRILMEKHMKRRLILEGEGRQKHGNSEAAVGCMRPKLIFSLRIRDVPRGNINQAASPPDVGLACPDPLCPADNGAPLMLVPRPLPWEAAEAGPVQACTWTWDQKPGPGMWRRRLQVLGPAGDRG